MGHWHRGRYGGESVDPRWQERHSHSPPFNTTHPTDNLTQVQTLVEQVKEKTSSIQALTHSTVGQSLPVRVQPSKGLGGRHSLVFLPMAPWVLFLFRPL